MMQGWYYVESLTGQRHDRVQTESQIRVIVFCYFFKTEAQQRAPAYPPRYHPRPSSAVTDNSVKQTKKDMPTANKNLSLFLAYQFSESHLSNPFRPKWKRADIGRLLINAQGKISLLMRSEKI